MYRVAVQLQGSVGTKKIFYGEEGRCRFCGTNDRRLFRQLAHLVPESLGNRRLFFREECDNCNQRFSVYEDALTAAVGPLLTLGGTEGKKGRVRQTGRTGGDTVLSHAKPGGKRQLRILASNVPDYLDRMTMDGDWLVIRTPLPPTPFRPLLAYKALLKVAASLLPAAALPRYQSLMNLVADRDGAQLLRPATIGLSFGLIGAAPPIVGAYLLERTQKELLIPEYLFLLCAGSVCAQTFLYADDITDAGIAIGTPRLDFTAAFPMNDGRLFRIKYGTPQVLDWSSILTGAQPLKEMVLRFNQHTEQGIFLPVWR